MYKSNKNEKKIYSELKEMVDKLMKSNNLDYYTMNKAIQRLSHDFDSVIKHRYPD